MVQKPCPREEERRFGLGDSPGLRGSVYDRYALQAHMDWVSSYTGPCSAQNMTGMLTAQAHASMRRPSSNQHPNKLARH
ncbi:BZIP domain-containing protein [Psidium guajava]|nr:BZIP domain-containing protein [Psidium guajava]